MKWIKFGVSGLLLAVLAWRTDWAQIADAFSRLDLHLWLTAFGLYLGSQMVSAWRWQLLSRPLGFGRPLTHYLGFYFIGMFFNLVLPTSVGGDVVRGFYLDGGSGRRGAALLSVLVERGSGLLVLLALACVAAFFCPESVSSWVPLSVWLCAGGAAFTLLAFFLVCQFLPAPVTVAAQPARSRLGSAVSRLRSLVAQAQATFLHRPGLLLATTVLSFVVQAGNVMVVWLVGHALGVDVPVAYYWIVVPMVTLLTLVPVSLNGMGIREGGMVLFLAPLGVARGAALSLTFLWFAVFTAASLLGGGVYLFGRFPRVEVGTDHGPVRGDSDQGRAGQHRTAA